MNLEEKAHQMMMVLHASDNPDGHEGLGVRFAEYRSFNGIVPKSADDFYGNHCRYS